MTDLPLEEGRALPPTDLQEEATGMSQWRTVGGTEPQGVFTSDAVITWALSNSTAVALVQVAAGRPQKLVVFFWHPDGKFFSDHLEITQSR